MPYVAVAVTAWRRTLHDPRKSFFNSPLTCSAHNNILLRAHFKMLGECVIIKTKHKMVSIGSVGSMPLLIRVHCALCKWNGMCGERCEWIREHDDSCTPNPLYSHDYCYCVWRQRGPHGMAPAHTYTHTWHDSVHRCVQCSRRLWRDKEIQRERDLRIWRWIAEGGKVWMIDLVTAWKFRCRQVKAFSSTEFVERNRGRRANFIC